MSEIRVIALGVIYNDGRLLVFEGSDDVKMSTFYRPLGGGVEFGERGGEALAREMREELGVEIRITRDLGALEDLFTFNGKTGHELVLLYEAALDDPGLYEIEEMEAMEDDGSRHKVLWMPIEHFRSGQAWLVPDGLLQYLEAHGAA